MARYAWILISCALLMRCASVPPAAQPRQSETVVAPAAKESDIRNASDQFWAARNRGDAAAFAAQFTDDGIFMVPGLSDAAGRTAVQALAEKRFAAARPTDFNVVRREIDVAGDSAYELGWFAETDRRGDQAMRMQGHYLLVWNRGSDDAWRVRRYLYNFSGAEPVP
jgi:uncharacterized protein (TIGR02246 family)